MVRLALDLPNDDAFCGWHSVPHAHCEGPCAAAKALDVMFLLHAEHEMNCSTAASRHLASSGVDVYSAVVRTVGWCSPRH